MNVGRTARTDEYELRQRTRQQQATLSLARELIAEVLDVQVRQFTENGLESLPVFSDIQQMRANIDQVTDDDMQAILHLLEQAQREPPGERSALFQQARQQARNVVTVLMAERERIRQRLKVAHVREQVKHLIDKQQQVRQDAQQIPTLADNQRDRATLSALEDQRDAHTLFDQLIESLTTIREWEGQEGQAAADSIQMLHEEGTAQAFDRAEAELSQGTVERAIVQQETILRQMARVLDRLEWLRGVDTDDPTSTLQQVQTLLSDQQQLLAETSAADTANQGRLDELSEKQNALHQRMSDLSAKGDELAGGEPWLESAENSAMQAEESLFEGNRDTAVAHQEAAVRNLSQLADLLEQTAALFQDPPTQESLASELQQLQQLQGNLDSLAQQQEQVVDDATAAPNAALELEQEVAQSLANESAREPLPPTTQEAVRQAADLAGKSAQTMQDPSPQNANSRVQAAQGVQQAIQAAQARAATALQAAQHAMQQATARSLAQAAQSRSGQPSRSSESSPARLDPQARVSSATEADRTQPQAKASRRTVADGQREDNSREPIAQRAFANSPWFARLPAELREAIRMQGRRKAPRGYEQRLRRYFESADK
jgi:hypothetical protein